MNISATTFFYLGQYDRVTDRSWLYNLANIFVPLYYIISYNILAPMSGTSLPVHPPVYNLPGISNYSKGTILLSIPRHGECENAKERWRFRSLAFEEEHMDVILFRKSQLRTTFGFAKRQRHAALSQLIAIGSYQSTLSPSGRPAKSYGYLCIDPLPLSSA